MPPPSPSRRDDPSPAAGDPPDSPCDCGGCREFRAIHAGFSLELPRAERLAKRATDRAALRRWEDADADYRAFIHARAV